ncbi:PbgP3 protein [Nitrobacter sp. Nb-311A]|uniref:methionyl-tRNA formyltransferase n=1 Tax=Nitrobacter sp. Nb-311A TaxID=314253 RepID=UPI0000687AA7|nr:formyltransferase family protein [Nitrobacter sp. Nb-311A]EAQ36376.1 PbgP3 protein [Nitrobacter sp. Nb-311A]
MPAFVITGDGHPAYTVLKAVHETQGASISAFIPGSSSAVKATAYAENNAIPILPRAMLMGREPFSKSFRAEWLVNINGTTIIDPGVIRMFAGRALNMHPGLLPKYAGLHCHQWAIRNGESVQGLTVHVMDAGIDTGPIMAQQTIPIYDSDTGLSLFMRAMEMGAHLLIGVLTRIIANDIPPAVPQNLSQRTLYRHKDALDGEVDWNWSARRIRDFVRAANYDPLVCPTYVPTALVSGVPVVLRVCDVARPGEHIEPGVLREVDGSPVIGCGNGEVVVIKRALRQGRIMTGSDWQQLVGSER